MCTHARPDGPLHGSASVAWSRPRTAPCPVVLVPSIRGRHPWALRQLVLPHDGTPTSAAAIAPTADLASRAGAELVVLHVATPGAERPTEPGTLVSRATSTSRNTSGRPGRESFSNACGRWLSVKHRETFASCSRTVRPARPLSSSPKTTLAISSLLDGAESRTRPGADYPASYPRDRLPSDGVSRGA